MNYSSENPAGIRNSTRGDTLDGKPIGRIASEPGFPKAVVTTLNMNGSGEIESADVGILDLENGGFEEREHAPAPTVEDILFQSMRAHLATQLN